MEGAELTAVCGVAGLSTGQVMGQVEWLRPAPASAPASDAQQGSPHATALKAQRETQRSTAAT
eukprot:3705732-Rhodomonas_salina.4